MRVDYEQNLVVVFLAMNKCHKETTGLRAVHVLEHTRLKAVVQLLTGSLLTLTQQARIAGRGSCASGFLELLISAIGKAQHQMIEALAEFLFPGQQGKAVLLRTQGRSQQESALPHKDGAGHLALYRRQKTHCSRVQLEGGGIAL